MSPSDLPRSFAEVSAVTLTRPGHYSADIDAGLADIAPLGTFALANPDVVKRLKTGAPFNELDPATIYVCEASGYTDYPTMAQTVAQED